MAPISTLHPDGPLACAISTLERLGCYSEVAEIKRLLVERLQFREEAMTLRTEAATLRAELALIRAEAREASAQAREKARVARQCLQNWKSLAIIQRSREELNRIDETLSRYPWLQTAA